MAFDVAKVVPIYQTEIDNLINQLGKKVELYFTSSVSNVSSDNYDSIRGANTRKPDYKTTVEKVGIVQVIKGLIKYNPSSYELADARVQQNKNIVRIKTFLVYLPDLLKCDYIIPNIDSAGYVRNKFKLVKGPVPIGLGEDRYCLSYWELV
ncbi:MAG: hypothetical protein WC942_11355 [Clostridia bacterium]|jgi:hypothetical protein